MTRTIQSPEVRYDRAHDVMHVYFPPAAPSFDDEDYPGIIIRRAMADERITGVTLLRYSRIPKEVLAITLPFLNLREIESGIAY